MIQVPVMLIKTAGPTGSPTPTEPVHGPGKCEEFMTTSVTRQDLYAVGSVRGSRPIDARLGGDKKWKASLRGRRQPYIMIKLPRESRFPVICSIAMIGNVAQAEITLYGRYEVTDAIPVKFTVTVDATSPVILSNLQKNGVFAPTLLSSITIKPLQTTDKKTIVETDISILTCMMEGLHSHSISHQHCSSPIKQADQFSDFNFLAFATTTPAPETTPGE